MTEPKSSVSRRSLLRRAGTVAAGAGVVAVGAASPAAAADVPVLLDAVNDGAGTTTIRGGGSSTSTLKLTNETGAAPLVLDPSTSSVPVASPLGTTFTDVWGDLHIIGNDPSNGFHYDNMLYSPTWAMMPFPLFPSRLVSTYPGDIAWGRAFLVEGSGTIDGAGRVIPKNSNQPDLIVDFSALLTGGFAAVQGNLTIGEATGAGFAALWDEGPWPGSSALNYQATQWTENFTQTILGTDMMMRFKLSKPGIFVFDISGLLLVDWTTQLTPDNDPTAKAKTAKIAHTPAASAINKTKARLKAMNRRTGR